MTDEYREVFWKGVRQIETDIYERCWFHPILCREGPPGFEFEVRQENEQTGEVIDTVSIRLTADEEVWEYIKKHPLWRKDPRLLFLMNLYDVLWRVKIIPTDIDTPFKTDLYLKPLQGGTITVEIRAEVLIDFGGVHVISVVNYANTHVRDQVDAVMKDNPSARPTDSYLRSVKERFFNDHIDAKRLKKKQQRHRLKSRNRAQLQHERTKVFIDESGDIGFRSLREPYILTAYIVPASAIQDVEENLRTILQRNWDKPPQELHFNRIPNSKLVSVRAEIGRCFLSFPGACVSLIGHKPGFLAYLLRCEAEARRNEEKPVKTNWAYLLDKTPTGLARATLTLFLEELLFHLGSQTLDFETPMEVFHDMKHREWMNEALTAAFKRSQRALKLYSKELYGEELPSRRTFKLVESPSQPCLWISDWISWELAKWYRGQQWSQSFESCFKKISFITFDYLTGKILIDRPEGEIVSAFPDVPREIASI